MTELVSNTFRVTIIGGTYTGTLSTVADLNAIPQDSSGVYWAKTSGAIAEDEEKPSGEYADPTYYADTDRLHGATGVWSVMSKWSGGLWDSSRKKLVIKGGGHTSYGGNEMYAFHVPTLTWERLSDPSLEALRGLTVDCAAEPLAVCVTGDGYSIYPDGQPSSTHSYFTLHYDSINDLYIQAGTGAYFSFSGGGGEQWAWRLDPTALTADKAANGFLWQRDSNLTVLQTRNEAPAVYDARTGRVLMYKLYNSPYISSYDAAAESQVIHASIGDHQPANIVINPVDDELWLIGGATTPFLIYDISDYEITGTITLKSTPTTTGDTLPTIVQNVRSSVTWDSKYNRAVFYGYDTPQDPNELYTIDRNYLVTRLSESASSLYSPPDDVSDGTARSSEGGLYNRMQYLPDWDVIIKPVAMSAEVEFLRLPPP